MNNRRQNSRETIIETAKYLIKQVDDIEKITIRQIAKESGVSIGLMNYHFKSKDTLLCAAIGNTMETMIKEVNNTSENIPIDPVVKLKNLVNSLYIINGENKRLIKFILSHEILDGNFITATYLIPILKEIYGNKEDETRLNILAIQILHPIQITALNINNFKEYSGIDLNDVNQRTKFIDILIDNLI